MLDPLRRLLSHRVYRGLELFCLGILLPTWVIVSRQAPYMFNYLWGTTLYCAVVYRLLYPDSFRSIVRWEAVNRCNLRPMLLRWAVLSLGMGVITLLLIPDRFLSLAERAPQFLVVLFILYPILSAVPQEFVFCSFLFRRYEGWFGRGIGMILASTVIFAYAHVLFINWVAPILSFLAGLIFAHTYARTRSLALVSIEHGLYGNALFFWGLGWYFYGGSIQS